ncbi:MAG TPA: CinA family protein [Burkholderiaceae bacterium]|jgi:nicotinamide-nucleotide amidase|nr:CinA family protein [Burkholderiaceae bacterium]
MNQDLALFEAQVRELGDALRARGLLLASAESCTGGLIAAACTTLAGSSDWFDAAFVTYSNAAKSAQLGVPAALIDAHGAVSDEVVRAMAEGALTRSQAGVVVAVTGIAGPSGGSAAKPVGTVWLAWARRGDALHSERLQLAGDRAAVRMQTVQRALQRARELL